MASVTESQNLHCQFLKTVHKKQTDYFSSFTTILYAITNNPSTFSSQQSHELHISPNSSPWANGETPSASTHEIQPKKPHYTIRATKLFSLDFMSHTSSIDFPNEMTVRLKRSLESCLFHLFEVHTWPLLLGAIAYPTK